MTKLISTYLTFSVKSNLVKFPWLIHALQTIILNLELYIAWDYSTKIILKIIYQIITNSWVCTYKIQIDWVTFEGSGTCLKSIWCWRWRISFRKIVICMQVNFHDHFRSTLTIVVALVKAFYFKIGQSNVQPILFVQSNVQPICFLFKVVLHHSSHQQKESEHVLDFEFCSLKRDLKYRSCNKLFLLRSSGGFGRRSWKYYALKVILVLRRIESFQSSKTVFIRTSSSYICK